MAVTLDWLRANWVLLAFLLGLTLVFLVLRTHPTEGIESLASLEAAANSGRPVVLEFYSNF
jgi:hypothetical protein